jgi:hypothetical protein
MEEHRSEVWEDLWDSFLDQVTPDYLKSLGVEAFFFYALRETTVTGLDRHDDDRSNFSLLARDGSARMEATTLARLQRFTRCGSGAED